MTTPRRADRSVPRRSGPPRRLARWAAAVGLSVLTVTGLAAPATAGVTDTAFGATVGAGSWSVSWDGGEWDRREVADGADADLILASDLTTVSFFEVFETPDVESCLDDLVPNIENGSGVTGGPTDDFDPDDLLRGDETRRAEIRTAVADAGSSTDETAFEGYGLFGCWSIAPDERTALLVVAFIAEETAEDGLAAVRGLYADVETRDSGGSVATPTEATPAGTPAGDDAWGGIPREADGRGLDAGTAGYLSPTFGYGVEWDDEVWGDASAASSGDPDALDLLQLTERDGSSVALVVGGRYWRDDLDDCLADQFANLTGLDVDDAEPLIDPDTGDPLSIETDTALAAGYVGAVDGDDAPVTVVAVCIRPGPDPDLIVGVTQISGSGGAGGDGDDAEDDYFADDFPLLIDLVGGVTAPEAADDDPGGGGSGEPTDDHYVSPTYGYELSWDPDVWSALGMSSSDGTDVLTLLGGDLQANLNGFVLERDDIRACVDRVVYATRDLDPDAGLLDTGDGPTLTVSDDGEAATAVVASTVEGEAFLTVVECHRLADGAAVSLAVTSPAEASEAEATAIEVLLAGLELP